jgi:hypothetical protein
MRYRLMRIHVLLCVAALAATAGCAVPEDAPMLDVPQRSEDAATGRDIAAALRNLSFEEREERIVAEIASGNVPSWTRRLERVEVRGSINGRTHRLVFWVAPDYLSLGSDDDFFLVPLSPRTARRVADMLGASLPTPGIVDAAWSAARVRLMPIRIRPDEHMRSVRYFERHNNLIRGQRWQHRVPAGAFVAGHKVDVVLARPDDVRGDSAGLYGWHLPTGEPIQPVYPLPADTPPQFSNGVRLVRRTILVDGARRDLTGAIADPALAPLLLTPRQH